MERELRLSHVITQNVDFLHGKAGTKELTELHGNGFKVICIGKGEKDNSCDYSIPRHEFQNILMQLNPALIEKENNLSPSSDQMKPDGDVEISQKDVESFFLPSEFRNIKSLSKFMDFFLYSRLSKMWRIPETTHRFLR